MINETGRDEARTTEPDPRPGGPATTFSRWIGTVLWLSAVGVIIYLADSSRTNAVFRFIQNHRGMDKLGHFVLIGGLAGLLEYSLRGRLWRGLPLGSLLVAVGCTVEELTQAFIPSRSFDLLDLAANFAGICFFGWVVRRFCLRREQL